MRICILSDHIPPAVEGGASGIAWNMAVECAKRGNEVVVVTTVRTRQEVGVSHATGVTVHALASAYPPRWQAYFCLWNPFVLSRVKKIFKEFKPDVVHAHNIHAHISYGALVIARRLGARTLLTCHDVMPFNYGKLTSYIDPRDLSVPKHFDYKISAWKQLKEHRFRYNPLRNLLIQHMLKKYVNRIVAVSNALKEALEQNSISPVWVVHNGIDAPAWQASEEAIASFKKKYKLGDSAIFFGGRLSLIKGSSQLVDAIAIVTARIPEVQLLVASTEDENTELMRVQAQELGIGGRLIFAGLLRGGDLRAAFWASSIVAVPSVCFDSFPTVNLEGMACGKPVIATCFGGSREAVEDGKTGYIVNPYNKEILAQKLIELLVDAKKRDTLGSAGYQRVVREFSIDKQIREYEICYSQT